MSDLSSLSHEYASSADFSRDLNKTVLLLKKRFVRGGDRVEHHEAIARLRGTLSNILRRLGDTEAVAQENEIGVPEDVLSRLEGEHRNDMSYFHDDLRRVLTALSTDAPLVREDLDLLDTLCEAADASASATFRKLWRR